MKRRAQLGHIAGNLLHEAETALSSARLLLGAGDTDGATNRAYYAMFDAATAALLSVGAASRQNPPKTHSWMISSFGLHLVQTGKLPAERTGSWWAKARHPRPADGACKSRALDPGPWDAP